MEHKVFAIPLAATTDLDAHAAQMDGGGSGNCRMGNPGAPGQVREGGTAGSEAQLEFIAGPENRLAGAAIEWLLRPGQHNYSPLVLHGPSGAGKSHLAQGVARARGDAVCTNGTEFAQELADAVERQTVVGWRERYRSAGLLVMEDLGQLVGKKAAQQELLHTLDALEAREATVVVTSQRPPGEMAGLSKGLRSRLAGGLVVSVAPPGVEARIVILEQLAGARGIGLAPEAARVLAEALGVTGGELRGALLELEGEATQGGRRIRGAPGQVAEGGNDEAIVIDLQHVRRYLALRRARTGPRLDEVSKLVASYYGLKPGDLSSPSRRRQVVLARNVAIYLGRQLTGSSLQQLGKHFGGRDHTTVLHSLRSIEQQQVGDGALRSAMTALRPMLEDRSNQGGNMSRRRR